MEKEGNAAFFGYHVQMLSRYLRDPELVGLLDPGNNDPAVTEKLTARLLQRLEAVGRR
jgi:hypothetical protein